MKLFISAEFLRTRITYSLFTTVFCVVTVLTSVSILGFNNKSCYVTGLAYDGSAIEDGPGTWIAFLNNTSNDSFTAYTIWVKK